MARPGARRAAAAYLSVLEVDVMTRGRYYSIAMPIAGILYVIALIATHGNGTVGLVGALLFAVVAATGAAFRGRAGTA